MYFVWKRNDGHVDSSNGGMPRGWTTTKGDTISFEKLGEFENWADAYDLIFKERAKKKND